MVHIVQRAMVECFRPRVQANGAKVELLLFPIVNWLHTALVSAVYLCYVCRQEREIVRIRFDHHKSYDDTITMRQTFSQNTTN